MNRPAQGQNGASIAQATQRAHKGHTKGTQSIGNSA